MVKSLPAAPETQVQPLGWEDPLEKGMATHSNILAWRIPWTEEPGGLRSMESQRVGHDWETFTSFPSPLSSSWGSVLRKPMQSNKYQNLFIFHIFSLNLRYKSTAINGPIIFWREWTIYLSTVDLCCANFCIWSHHFMGNRWANSGNSVRLYFFGLQNHCRWWLQPWN